MRTIPYSQALSHICALIGIPTSRLTTETAQVINDLFNANVRQIWGAGNWSDVSVWGEARFAGNLLTYPNDLSQTSSWTATNATITGNSIANPADNRTTACKILETVTNGAHKAVQASLACFPSTKYQLSLYARPNGRDYIYLAANDGTTTFSAFFNVTTGAVGTTGNVDSAGMQQQPNGYYLCTINYTSGAAASAQSVTVQTSSDGSTLSYAGDTAKGFYVWGVLLTQQTNVSPQLFSIPSEQTGENVIDALFTAWIDNPAMSSYPRQRGFVVTDTGYQMITASGGFSGASGYVAYNTNPSNPIYLYYRKAPPKFSGSTFSATATYVAGQYIYYTLTSGANTGTSDYYKVLSATSAGNDPEDSPTLFQIQQLPEGMAQPLVWQTYGDWLVQDGQAEKAAQAYQMAEMKRLEEWDRTERQQPNSWQMNVNTHIKSIGRTW